MRRSIAGFLFALCLAAQAHAVPYLLASHVGGSSGFFQLDYFGFETTAEWVPFDIYFNTVVDYDGTGQLAAQPAEVSILLRGDGFLDAARPTGKVSARYVTNTVDGVTRSTLYYDLYVDMATSGYGDTLSISHRISFVGDPLGGNLTTPLPLGPAAGSIDYTITHYNELGSFTVGSAFGAIEHASFELIPVGPVPEPAQYAMLLAGLALAATGARRRA